LDLKWVEQCTQQFTHSLGHCRRADRAFFKIQFKRTEDLSDCVVVGGIRAFARVPKAPLIDQLMHLFDVMLKQN
jgi:hypothetical protein